MTKKELHHILRSLGVQPLIYKWEFQTLENPCLEKKLLPIFDNIDSFIKDRNVCYIYFFKHPVLASQIGVTFLKVALLSGWTNCYYSNPVDIAGYLRESWDNGNAYGDLVKADLLVVDKVTNKLENYQLKILNDFAEERTLQERATIWVGAMENDEVFDIRVLDTLQAVKARVLLEDELKFL